ncbi:TraR/DksA C4-type zinc finger protein [Acinetobacter sp. HY1485]|uniref:TraR/DksA C4-type zinc finger protein n=1 Tax=Acinetobacter sp. HY1485 TaxID=2970918 RepID=UPI003FA4AC18
MQLKQVAWVKQDYQTPSLVECEECGNDIPVQRQKYGNVNCILNVPLWQKNEDKPVPSRQLFVYHHCSAKMKVS